MATLSFSCGDVTRDHSVSVQDRSEAERVIWSRFSEERNSLNAENTDWGKADCLMMLDEENKVWYCRYTGE